MRYSLLIQHAGPSFSSEIAKVKLQVRADSGEAVISVVAPELGKKLFFFFFSPFLLLIHI